MFREVRNVSISYTASRVDDQVDFIEVSKLGAHNQVPAKGNKRASNQ